jgi:two-component sensor histidine kinase
LYYKEELLGKTLIISNIDREKNQFAQKDLLIKEVHHRVKSNLQLILSLLNLDL